MVSLELFLYSLDRVERLGVVFNSERGASSWHSAANDIWLHSNSATVATVDTFFMLLSQCDSFTIATLYNIPLFEKELLTHFDN